MHDFIEALRQTFDSKVNASIASTWAMITVVLNLSNIAVFCSICLTCIMIVRQAIGLRKDLRGHQGSNDVDT